MPDTNAQGRQGGALNPQALQLVDMARILSASGQMPVIVETLQTDSAYGRRWNQGFFINSGRIPLLLEGSITGGFKLDSYPSSTSRQKGMR